METLVQPDTALLETVRRARVRANTLALWYTGGAGYILRSAGATILIDPFLGPSNPPHWMRAIPPAFDPERVEELGQIDAVLLTHEHGDHADPVALDPLGRRTLAIVGGPESCIAVAREAGFPLDRCLVLAHDELLHVGDVRVTAVAMHDPAAKGCNGYVIESGDVTLLHCGDSVYFSGFLELGKRWAFDAICLSVAANPPGRAIYMDEVDAARAARDAGTRILIPQHFDLWQGFTLDPRRVTIAAGWYCPEVQVRPARFCRRLTIEPDISKRAEND
ncbi:MAG TPA: MBL fold metallo-hydrolase [Thermomicrobiales bacterium]|nr:MBL fold metallo-hydrolase [Thermomicrobiales bacterium]